MQFRMTQIGTTFQMIFGRNEALTVNCYFVEEDEGLTLIDTAVHECFADIVNTAAKIGKSITGIALTHAHHDHTGSLDALIQAFPDIPVYISVREARLLLGDRTMDPHEPDTPIRGNFPMNMNTSAAVLLQDGHRIGSLIALATPGHTPGSMSFLDTRNQHVFAGDAFQSAGGIAVSGQLRSSFPYPALGTWNNRVSLESARKLLNYRPALLATGHGDMLADPYAEMKLAIDEAACSIESGTHLKQKELS